MPCSCCSSISSCSLRRHDGVERVVHVDLRAGAIGRASVFLRSTSRCLSSTVSLRERDARCASRSRLALQVGEIGAHAGEPAPRPASTRDAERLGIDLEQLVAGVDALALAHGDVRDLAGDVRRDQHLLRADIGVVGRDVAAASRDRNSRADASAISGSTTSRIDAQRLRDERARGLPSDGATSSWSSCASVRRLCRPWRPQAIALRRGSSAAFPGNRAARRFSSRAREFVEHAFDRRRVEAREHGSPSCPGRARRAGPSAGAPAGVRCRRLARRSFGSGRRSIRPFAHSRSTSRVSVIG